jgi:hypothetical protein
MRYMVSNFTTICCLGRKELINGRFDGRSEVINSVMTPSRKSLNTAGRHPRSDWASEYARHIRGAADKKSQPREQRRCQVRNHRELRLRLTTLSTVTGWTREHSQNRGREDERRSVPSRSSGRLLCSMIYRETPPMDTVRLSRGTMVTFQDYTENACRSTNRLCHGDLPVLFLSNMSSSSVLPSANGLPARLSVTIRVHDLGQRAGHLSSPNLGCTKDSLDQSKDRGSTNSRNLSQRTHRWRVSRLPIGRLLYSPHFIVTSVVSA